jgi:putative membrane protein
MLGSLGKVWPWKYTTAYAINRHGGEIPLVQENVMPGSFHMLTGQDPSLGSALGLMLLGVVLVLVMDRVGRASRL